MKIQKWDEVKPALSLMQTSLEMVGYKSPEDFLHANGVCTDGLDISEKEYEMLTIGVLLGMAIDSGIVGTKTQTLAEFGVTN